MANTYSTTSKRTQGQEEVRTVGQTEVRNAFKEQLEREAAAKQKAQAEKAEQEYLDNIKPVNIVETIDEIAEGVIRVQRDDNGNAVGVNGGKLIQKMVTLADGSTKVIAADSEEALEELKDQIDQGLSGDGKYHKLICIGGFLCDCVGDTPEMLEKDILEAKAHYVRHSGNVIGACDKAELAYEVGYTKNDLIQIKGNDENDYFIDLKLNVVRSLDFEELVNLDDLHSHLSKEDIVTILTDRLNSKIAEESKRHVEDMDPDDECDDYDGYEDEWDEDEEEDESDSDDCENETIIKVLYRR